MELLDAVEQWPAVRLLKTSFYAYPLVNAAHIAAIGALLTGIGLMDLRLLGGLRSLPEEAFVRLMRRLALGAFAVAAATGALLFSVRAGDYAAHPVFLAKMALILLAGLNLALFAWLARGRQSGAAATRAQRLCAMVSMVLWAGVLLCGRFIGFV